jgi:streptomycin 6-kinase
MDRFVMPRNLVEAAERDGRQEWMSRLPALIQCLADRWCLEVSEPYQPGGDTAWVAPARGESGEELVLKVVWRHPEAEHEGAGLLAWAGRGAIRLQDSWEHDDVIALLLERCTPGTPLRDLPEPEQDMVIAGLLRRLWIEPSRDHGFVPLERMCDQWADRFEKDVAVDDLEVDPGLVREAITLFRELPRTAERHVLLCTDMHAGNVLAAKREPWLAIDPKPYVGDPTYDVLQHLLNCEQRLRSDPQGLAARMAGLLDLDCDRLLSWLFARCVQFSPSWPFLAEVARRVAPAQ